ncbi:hypothetical protein [Bartonella sp. TT29SHDZB]|uniref:hypothetical protein n=1 Tax=Bartonella sp. TT29SHDZB TaxID=3243581 RepID=UPI0035CF3B6D
MRLKFKQQEFQNDAVKSVIDLFKGQPRRDSSIFLCSEQGQLALNEFGYGNQLLISDETILANLQEVQQNNKLVASETLEQKQFSIEMETGTGKTYVYSKTIF